MDDFLGLVDLAIAPEAPTGIFNVSTGEGRSIKDVYDAVVAYLGVSPEQEVPVVPAGADDIPAVVLDPSATEAAFGWRAQIGFEDTIARMLARSEEHTSELQSLMRISYAVFCLKKKRKKNTNTNRRIHVNES